MKKKIKQKFKIIFFYQKYIHLWENTLIHCCWIFHQACHNEANGIKSGSNSEMTDKRAAEYSKTASVCCINCSYKSIARSISLLASFVCTVKFSYSLELLKLANP